MVRDASAIGVIADPASRAKAAHGALREVDRERSLLIDIRRLAVGELRVGGWSWQAIASLLGIHRNRAAHLLDPVTARTTSRYKGPKPL